MTDDRLAQMEERLNDATPGPWKVDEPRGPWHVRAGGGTAFEVPSTGTPVAGTASTADATFIAQAPGDLRWCIERIRELEEALGQHGHVVDIGETRFGLEHPIECRREGLLNCPLDRALTALDGRPRPVGRYFVELAPDGELSFEPVDRQGAGS